MKNSEFLAFVGGAIAGAAIALLFAPARGEDTRRRLRGFIDEQKERMCGCGPECECGCQDGEPCTCETKPEAQ